VVAASERVVLRAELALEDRILIAHTLHVSETGAVVQLDARAPLGSHIAVKLSFPGLLSQGCAFEAELVSKQLARGPGEPATWELRWVAADDHELERLRRFLYQLCHPDLDREEPLRILLVEDSRMTRQVFELGVSRLLGHRIGALVLDWAEDAELGWKKLRASSYDVVIVDCLLPGIPGTELIRQLREHVELRATPIVAMSVGGEPVRRSALEAGADFFVHKPVVVGDLLATLERLGRARGSS
jgi:CheY-like chemotaxis protein